MSEVDLESQMTSGDEGVVCEKLVPVGEAIRYRKRAQSAEVQVAELEVKLSDLQKKNSQIAKQLKGMETDQQLASKLTMAGARDLETAVLIAKARLGESEDGDVESMVEELKKDKSYLFDSSEPVVAASKTLGVKDKKSGGRRTLESAAKRAATSGSRADVQEYLRVRRQFI